jgi:uncharacterized RDD family membrane protein YckC
LLLSIAGLAAVAGAIGAIMSEGDEAWWILAFGCIPLALYLPAAWVIAGFVDSDSKVDPAAEVTTATQVEIMILAERWPRFWARMADTWIEISLLGLSLGAVAPQIVSHEAFAGPGGDQLLGVLMLPFALVLDAAIVAFFGNSLGKFVAGIRVADIRGQRIEFRAAFARNLRLWPAGLALGVPIANLFTFYRGSRTLLDNQLVSWDIETGTRVYAARSSLVRTCLAAGIVLVVAFGLAAVNVRNNSPDAIARASVDAVNAMGSRMIDDETRLDGAETGGANGDEIRYNYTFVNVSTATHDLDVVRGWIQDNMVAVVTKETCDDPQMRTVLRAGVSLSYRYFDADGISLGEVPVSSWSCPN